ncbi:unnamed protein product [Symbiodinium sp. CCMP2592]|nr:unnamed protein product [Symbiodinium sp. CCMP2592]
MIVMNRYCFPDSSGLLKSAANSLESGLLSQRTERLLEQLSSVPAAWPVLLIAFFLAVLLGYMYLVALRHCTVLLIWLVMALSVAGSALLGCYLWANAGTLSRHLPSGVAPPEGYGDNEELVTKVMAALCWILCCICCCVACCFRQSIEAAVDCIEEACEAIQEMSSLLLAPILKERRFSLQQQRRDREREKAQGHEWFEEPPPATPRQSPERPHRRWELRTGCRPR